MVVGIVGSKRKLTQDLSPAGILESVIHDLQILCQLGKRDVSLLGRCGSPSLNFISSQPAMWVHYFLEAGGNEASALLFGNFAQQSDMRLVDLKFNALT